MVIITHRIPQTFGKTLVLRGFTDGIDWKHIVNSSEYHHTCIVQDIIKVIKAKAFQTVVWDRDLYKSGSFTHIIFELMNAFGNSIQFVAF